MVYRNIETSLWDDPKVLGLPAPGKLLFVYLITNRHTHVSGIYVLPPVLAQFETGLKPETWDTLCHTLSEVGLVRFDVERSVVWVVRMFEYQGKGEKNEKSAAKHLDTLHKSPMIKDFLRTYPGVKEHKSHRVSHRVSRVGVQEQDQEQDQEQKNNPPKPPKGGDVPGFAEFWTAYPKKIGKDAARKAWAKRTGVPLPAILSAIREQAQSEQWRKDGGQFIPNPATWLNQGRWEDEVPRNGAAVKQRTALALGAEREWGKPFDFEGQTFILKFESGHRGLWRKDPAAHMGWVFKEEVR